MNFLHRNQSRLLLPVISVIACGLVLCASAIVVHAQPSERLQRAVQLYEAQNFVAAIPLLEAEAEATPDSTYILSRLGFALYAVSATEKDTQTRTRMRTRSREVLLKSQSLGDDSNLTRITLTALSQDEAHIPFSDTKGAEDAIRKGEAAFVRGDLDAAFELYKKALELDPKLYDAALYAGDSLFKKGYAATDPQTRAQHFESAGVWFAKAIAIDPNRETAYRYWGDALDQQGKTEAARDKFVEAIVADPSSERAYMGLTQWGQRHGVPMAHPKVDIPANLSVPKPGEVNISIEQPVVKEGNPDGSAAWLMYALVRASWANDKKGLSEKFAKAYPGETQYRHSLAEEAEALRMTAESVAEQMKDKKISQLSSSLSNVIKLKNAGLLEPYVLFARADRGIVRDYIGYRNANREKLKQYWLQMVISKTESRGYN